MCIRNIKARARDDCCSAAQRRCCVTLQLQLRHGDIQLLMARQRKKSAKQQVADAALAAEKGPGLRLNAGGRGG
jgi:hypothetical protein